MKKSVKIISVILILITLCAISSTCFATDHTVGGVTFTEDTSADVSGLTNKAAKIVGALQKVAAVIAVIIIAILGIKYMLGSVEEKAEYKKSFMPLIIGVAVVLLTFQIAGIIFGLV